MARTPRQDDPGVAAWAALLRAHAAVVARIERDLLAAKGLSLAWYDVLLELEHAPDHRLRMRALGERAVLSRSRVSRIVDELVAAGLVQREPDPVDRRGAHAVLTPAGRSRLRRAAPTYLRAIDEHFSRRLSPAELDVLRLAGQRLAAEPGDEPGDRLAADPPAAEQRARCAAPGGAPSDATPSAGPGFLAQN